MTEEIRRGPGRPPKIQKNDEDDDRRDIEEILGEIEPNARVKVTRLEPEWASGYLGQFYISAGKRLSTEEIKNRFGGRVLQLTIHGPNGKYVKRQTVLIDDVPRREGKVALRDGTVIDGSDAKSKEHPLETMMGWGLPPNLARQISNHYLGAGDESQQHQSNSFTDMAGAMGLQKIMMDMMAQSNQANMQMMQFQFEMQKNMMAARQDFEKNAKPTDPLGDVTSMIQVFRELNGMKSEFGGTANESMAGKILENTMPMVETLGTEYLAYLRMKAQADANKPQAAPPPALPSRQTEPPNHVFPTPATNPVNIAQKMATMYKNLSQDDKKVTLRAFMQALNGDEPDEMIPLQDTNEIKVDSVKNNGIMEKSPDLAEYLEKDDLEILQHGGSEDNQDAVGNIQNSEYTGPAEKNDPAYRQSDS